MTFRPLLKILACGLPLLMVMFGVLMGGYAMAEATGPPNEANIGAAVLWYVAMASLLLLSANIILLVGLLGLDAAFHSDTHCCEPAEENHESEIE